MANASAKPKAAKKKLQHRADKLNLTGVKFEDALRAMLLTPPLEKSQKFTASTKK
jgi:hypothetical protein